MDKISIIIPIYNSEPYIRKCLDSVINQTYTNLEILCIDDGSNDRSMEICNEYAMKDNRICIFHKAFKEGSGTPVNSMNIGLKNFNGQYVGFIDHDDWIEPDMYEVLYNTVKKMDVKIGVVNFFWDTVSNSVAETNDIAIPDKILTPKEMLLYTFHRECYRSFYFPAWNKLYSADIFKKNKDICFNADYHYASDALFNVQVFLTDGCTGAYNDKPLYHYYRRESSITNNTSTRMKNDDLKVWELIIDLLENKGYYDISIWVKKIHAFHAGQFAESALIAGDSKLFIEFQNKMKYFSNIYIEKNQNYPDRVKWFNNLLNKEWL